MCAWQSLQRCHHWPSSADFPQWPLATGCARQTQMTLAFRTTAARHRTATEVGHDHPSDKPRRQVRDHKRHSGRRQQCRSPSTQPQQAVDGGRPKRAQAAGRFGKPDSGISAAQQVGRPDGGAPMDTGDINSGHSELSRSTNRGRISGMGGARGSPAVLRSPAATQRWRRAAQIDAVSAMIPGPVL
jgi:hypothetical protein